MTNINKINDIGLRNIVIALLRWKGEKGIKILQKAINKVSDKKLLTDGIFGKNTLRITKNLGSEKIHKALSIYFSNKSPSKYIDIAKKELGVREGKNNNRILKYHKVSGGFTSVKTPWCGSFVNWVMEKSGYKTVKGASRAKNWIKFGVKTTIPYYGSIAIKNRKGGGHVTFVVGKSKNGKYLYCLGGNQGDAVTIRKYRANVFTDFRLPKSQERIALKVYNKNVKLASKEY